jgi:hypothetical protein
MVALLWLGCSTPNAPRKVRKQRSVDIKDKVSPSIVGFMGVVASVVERYWGSDNDPVRVLR